MRSFPLLLACLAVIQALGQNPNPVYRSLNYQGVARDASGDPLANQTIGVKFIVGYGIGNIYSEAQTLTTNDHGLFTAKIGEGIKDPFYPDFQDLGWSTTNPSNLPFWLHIGIDPTGGTSHVFSGPPENISAVPFAQRARFADHAQILGDSAWVPVGPDTLFTNRWVGIGTSSPKEPLEVVTPTSTFRVVENFTAGYTTTALEVIGAGLYGPWMTFTRETAPAPLWIIGMNETQGFSIANGSNKLLTASVDNKIGIGTSAPDTTAHIVGKLKYQDGSEGSGKVLGSDAGGAASWISEIPSEPWSGISLEPDWTALGDPAGYYKDPIGRVHLRGSLQNSLLLPSALDTVFQLPPGYRPSTTVILQCQGYETATNDLLKCLLYVDPAGNVFIYPYDTPINGMILLLNSVSFRAEQ